MIFGYMLKRNRNKTLQKMSNTTRAVIDHFFHKHDYCNKDWFLPLVEQTQKQEIVPSSDGRGRSGAHPDPPTPPKRPQLFFRDIDWETESSTIKFGKYISPASNHTSYCNPCITMTPKSMNPPKPINRQICTKNKWLGSTMLLTHCVYVAVGIHNMGFSNF